MNIETEHYQIARLNEEPQAVEIIREAENKIAEMIGRNVTLIAYSESGREQEPIYAPGIHTDNPLEERATEEEIRQGDSTPVTRLYLDRTPDD